MFYSLATQIKLIYFHLTLSIIIFKYFFRGKNKNNRQHKNNFTMYLKPNSQNVNKMGMFPLSDSFENKILYRK